MPRARRRVAEYHYNYMLSSPQVREPAGEQSAVRQPRAGPDPVRTRQRINDTLLMLGEQVRVMPGDVLLALPRELNLGAKLRAREPCHCGSVSC